MGAKRQVNIECLRILCILLITLFHFVFHGNFIELLERPENRIVSDLVYHFGEIGVDCFILISGYFLSKTEFKAKKIALILLEMEFYIIISKIILFVTSNSPAKWSAKDFFPIIDDQYWFVHVYLLIYVLTPLLKKLVKILTKLEISSFLLLQILIWSAFPTFVLGVVFGNEYIELMPFYNRYVWLIVVYLTGHYIKEYGLPFKLDNVNPLIIVMLLTGLLIGYITLCEIGAIKLSPVLFWPPNSTIVFLISVFLFCSFLRWKPCFSGKLVSVMAGCSLGIYLLQDGFLRGLLWNELFAVTDCSLSSLEFMYRLFSAAILVFFVGVAIDLIRQSLEKWIIIPLINKASGVTP